MPLDSIKSRIEPKYYTNNKIKINNKPANSISGQKVSFQGAGVSKAPNIIVGMMDFIAAGGYAASFIIQDGLGFVLPRVGKGLVRGGKKKKDENGNDILDKNGQPKRELNWAYARKEGLREIITGPSAFVIPYFMLKYIDKKFGTGNNVRLDYINGFADKFKDQVSHNIDAVKDGTLDKKGFYEEVFKDVLNKTVNVEGANQLSEAEIANYAKNFTDKQIKIEAINADKNLTKAQRNAKLEELGSSVVDDFMALKKKHIGGNVNEMAINITSANGVKGGNIGELLTAMNDYFSDAVKNTQEALKKEANANIDEIIKKFTSRRMGSRLLTNIGLFFTVAMFYTQIPKLYNLGTHGKNPALMNEEEEEQQKTLAAKSSTDKVQENQKKNGQNVSFSGNFNSVLEKAGDKVFNSQKLKSWSDIFELNGPVIQGNAMAILLYAFCVPPRLVNAQDKYDFGEVLLRDMVAFTTFLFGAKAIARLFSDGFTKITGLALNKKNMQGRNIFQKMIDYLNPTDSRHSVLSSKQLESKYTNLEDYKDRIQGFMDGFIKKSGGDVKKAFAKDADAKSLLDKILKEFNGSNFSQANSAEIEQALINADKALQKSAKAGQTLTSAEKTSAGLMKEFYGVFKNTNSKPNGLLKAAKTCNSAFGFVSTLVLVPGFIIALTDICKKMTDKRRAKEHSQSAAAAVQVARAPLTPSKQPTMAGFLNSK